MVFNVFWLISSLIENSKIFLKTDKVEQSALKEVIDHKKGEEYLSGVCSAYLACYRFISAAHHFQISVSKEKSELDDLWKTIETLLRHVLTF